jgi:tight adherence protein C
MMDILLNNGSGILLLCAVAMGVSAALLGWLLSKAAADVPQEDRQYKDPPPLGFRLVWWPIQWISYYLQPLISRRAHAKLLGKLRKAGLDYCLSPAQFTAARILCGIAAGLLCCWVLASFNRPDAGKADFTSAAYLQAFIYAALAGGFYPGIWLKDRLMLRRRELFKTLPFYLDIITLCVEAGLNLQGAIQQAVVKGPKGVLRDEFQRVLRDVRAGKPRAEALRNMAQRLNEPAVGNFTIAVIQAESMGMSLGPVLRAQADQRRTERFLRAEKLAMEAPVKLLFPLIAFIFPCTFIVLFFPIVMKFMESGL